MATKKYLDVTGVEKLVTFIRDIDSAGEGIDITRSGEHKNISVKYDGSSIVLNSKGELSAQTQTLSAVEPIFIDSANKINLLFDNSTIKLTADKKLKADLSAYSLISETGSKIDLYLDSEFKLYAMLYDKNDTLISTSECINLPLEQAIINITYDDATKELIFTLRNGVTTRVPLGSIVSGLASQTWVTENFQKKLVAGSNILLDSSGVKISAVDTKYYDGKGVIVDSENKLNIAYDNETLKINDSNELEVLTTDISFNKGIEITSEGVVNVLFDNSSIKLNARGELSVEAVKLDAIKPIIIDSENNITLSYDNDTIKVDSEGKLYATAQEISIDNKTIVENSAGEICVPIDNKTIKVDSEGYIGTDIFELTIGDGLYLDSAGALSVEGDLIGFGDGLEFEDNIVSVAVDSETIRINSEGKLYAIAKNLKANAPIIIDSEDNINLGYTNRFTTSGNRLELADHQQYIKSETLTNGKVWTGTRAEYEAIATKDENTLYNIVDDNTEFVALQPDRDTILVNSGHKLYVSDEHITEVASKPGEWKTAILASGYDNNNSHYCIVDNKWCILNIYCRANGSKSGGTTIITDLPKNTGCDSYCILGDWVNVANVNTRCYVPTGSTTLVTSPQQTVGSNAYLMGQIIYYCGED